MSDRKVKLQLRPNFLKNEKSPPPSKLFLSHGKPNFTISRSPKTPTNTSNPMSPDANELERVMLKRVPSSNGSVNSDNSTPSIPPSTPTSITPTSTTPTSTPFGTLKSTKANHYNGNAPAPIPLSNENEISRVVLRSTNQVTLRNPTLANGNKDEPEFITAQRKIAGRLAQDENSFDIELAKKRSSYTEILSTPTLSKSLQYAEIEKARMSSGPLVEENENILKNSNGPIILESPDKAEIIAASTKPSAELISEVVQENFVEDKSESVPPVQQNGTAEDNPINSDAEATKTEEIINENSLNNEEKIITPLKDKDYVDTNGNENKIEIKSEDSPTQDTV